MGDDEPWFLPEVLHLRGGNTREYIIKLGLNYPKDLLVGICNVCRISSIGRDNFPINIILNEFYFLKLTYVVDILVMFCYMTRVRLKG